MKEFNDMKTITKLALLGSALALGAGPVFAVDHYIAAKAFAKTLPDGSTVSMWGYVIDPDNSGDGVGDCYQAPTRADRLVCVNGLPEAVSPGPQLTVPADDQNLRVFLSNGLPEATSLVITGQEMPFSQDDNGPTWNDGTLGARTDPAQRVRSFGREALSNGGRQRYLWNTFRATPFVRPGGFVYHSATHPQKQVYMGLYGAVTKNAVEADAVAGTPAEAYPGVPYDNEVVLFYSDIDPAHNAAVVGGTYTTSIDYHASWFLVNGEPYASGVTPDIPAGAAGETTLVRLFSAASETHVPVLQGMHMMIHAEDGLPYTYQAGATVAGTAPRTQYSAMLPPLKTKDATILVPATATRLAIYDGNGSITNPSNPDDVAVGDTVGGMLRFLSFGP
mgnify:FL=1